MSASGKAANFPAGEIVDALYGAENAADLSGLFADTRASAAAEINVRSGAAFQARAELEVARRETESRRSELEAIRARGENLPDVPGFAEARAEIARDPQLLDSVRGALERHLETAEKRGEAVFRADDLSGGFELPGAMAVVAKSDRMLVPRRSMRRALPDARAGRRLSAADSLQPGELVVHIDHGIGRFLGSSEIETDGKRCEDNFLDRWRIQTEENRFILFSIGVFC